MTENFDEIFKIMQDSFPNNEHRGYERQKGLLEVDKYSIKVRTDEKGKIIGFMSSWKLDGFIFIEHLAVCKESRGKGIGSAILKEYIQETNFPLVLEVETEDNDICKRRIMFYKHLGFYLNFYNYSQLPLNKNDDSVRMYIMSYPEKLDEKNFERVKKEIYTKVYLNKK